MIGGLLAVDRLKVYGGSFTPYMQGSWEDVADQGEAEVSKGHGAEPKGRPYDKIRPDMSAAAAGKAPGTSLPRWQESMGKSATAAGKMAGTRPGRRKEKEEKKRKEEKEGRRPTAYTRR